MNDELRESPPDGRAADLHATRASPAGRAFAWSLRAAFVVLAAAVIWTGPLLHERLAPFGGCQGLAAWTCLGVGVVSLLIAAIRAPSVLPSCARVMRRRPVLTAILILNLAVFGLLVLNIFTEWGVIALLGAGAVGAITLCARASEGRERFLDKLLLMSPLSFGFVYAALAAGEVYLRAHPELVGDGGGGNPALRQLYDGMHTVNSLGLRGREYAELPAAGTTRILAVGDSFTFGQGIGDDDTWPAQLERTLRSSSGESVEVLNAGRSGIDTMAELDYVRRQGLALQPDLVIVQFYANDIVLSAPRSEVVEVNRINQVVDRLIKRPLRRSYVVFMLRRRFDVLLTGIEERTTGKTLDYMSSIALCVERRFPPWRRFVQAARGLAELRRETGVPVAMVLFPHPGEPHPKTPAIHAAVADQVRKIGLPVLDLDGAVRTIPPDQQIANSFDHHPSREYCRVAATSIASWLIAEGLLQR